MRQPVWTLEEARVADRRAVEAGVAYAGLLSVAGFQLGRFVRSLVPDGPIVILTGPGSNGGDGWVAARYLAQFRPVSVIPVAEPRFPEAENWVRAAKVQGVRVLEGVAAQTELSRAALVVDSIYGTGFHGSVMESPAAPWLHQLAGEAVAVVHTDLPSGVDTNTGQYEGPRLNSLATLAMGGLKWGHVSYPGADQTGSLVIADIGLDGPADAHWIDAHSARSWMPQVGSLAHKYRRGRVVVVGGSRDMPGAPFLAAMGALKSGAGIVEVVVPESALGRVTASAALIVHGVPESAAGDLVWSARLAKHAASADALVVGPGLGRRSDPRLLLELMALNRPTVLDADGIRLAASLNCALPSRWVMTPHAGEMGAWLNQDAAAVNQNRRGAVLAAVKKAAAPVLLKGRFSLIGSEGHIWVNPTGDSALATAGSGDVLSGIIARLLAGGLDGPSALALGAYWHGWAGELGGQALGMALTSVDLWDWIGAAAKRIDQAEEPHAVRRW